MNFSRDQLIQRIRSWAVLCKDKKLIEDAYLFGSLIYEQGDLFDPGESDFDIIVLLPRSTTNPLSRVATLDNFVQLNHELVRDLMCLLKRKDATQKIASIIPVTYFELSTGIHKGNDPDLFQNNEFLDLLDEKANLSPLPSPSKVSHDNHHSVIQAMQGAQAFRNAYISISANQQRFIESFKDDKDPLPKSIMRSAQQLSCYKAGQRGDFQYDVNQGTQFISELLKLYAKDDTEYTSLYRQLLVRRGRGIRKDLEPRDLLLLWEILASEAEKALRASGATSGRDESIDVGPTTPAKPPVDGSSPISAASSTPRPSNPMDEQRSSAQQYRQPDVPVPPTIIRWLTRPLAPLLALGIVLGAAILLTVLPRHSWQPFSSRPAPTLPGMAIIPTPTEVAPFALDITEVTREAFAVWLNQMGGTPADGIVIHKGRRIIDLSGKNCGIDFQPNGDGYVARQGKAKLPVACMSQEGAQDYCFFKGKRLPTAKELTVAAYGPLNNRQYPWGDQRPSCERTVYGRRSDMDCGKWGEGPVEVMSTPGDVTLDGIYDLGGNVAEWVADDDDQGHRFFGGDWGRSDKPLDKKMKYSHLKRGDGSPVTNLMGDNIGFRCAIGLSTSTLAPWTKTP